MLDRITIVLNKPVHIAPIATLRVAIGFLMAVSTIRFLALGWVADHYIDPVFHFKYFGFQWVEVLPPMVLYTIHGIMIAAAVAVMLGWQYRIAAVVLFLGFTYTELIDLVYYLNHYYFVSIVLFVLIFAPAHRYFSLDALRNQAIRTTEVPQFWKRIFQLMLAIVYIYAGLAKINHTWLFEALPLKIWLPAADAIPVLGPLFAWPAAPYIFSWVGMIYDSTIVFFLLWQKSRPWAYIMVVVFHILTGILFQIGVFPLVMIAATLIFFSEHWHVKLISGMRHLFLGAKGILAFRQKAKPAVGVLKSFKPISRGVVLLAALFFAFQLVFPWRYLLYPGNLFWTEEGYRFSWRVMLMEKAGTATFYVKDGVSGREGIVVNSAFLNPHQEKQMAMQPDMILQFAHFLGEHYAAQGVQNPSVRAEVYVTLNAQPSQLLIDPQRDLTQIRDGWKTKDWIMPAP